MPRDESIFSSTVSKWATPLVRTLQGLIKNMKKEEEEAKGTFYTRRPSTRIQDGCETRGA
jgi:hypothetical protein